MDPTATPTPAIQSAPQQSVWDVLTNKVNTSLITSIQNFGTTPNTTPTGQVVSPATGQNLIYIGIGLIVLLFVMGKTKA